MKKTSGKKGREREVPKRKSNTMSRQTLTRNTNQEVCRESIVRKPLQEAIILKNSEKHNTNLYRKLESVKNVEKRGRIVTPGYISQGKLSRGHYFIY
jgi:CTP-dependent riboflavin kinase